MAQPATTDRLAKFYRAWIEAEGAKAVRETEQRLERQFDLLKGLLTQQPSKPKEKAQ